MLRLPKLAFMILYLHVISESGRSGALRNELVITSGCTCPGFNLTYECTVSGTVNGFTLWRGSAFDCASDNIILTHWHYTTEEGAMRECNEGFIVGRRLGFQEDGGSFYISQLSVRVSPQVIGKSIECTVVDTNVTQSLVGNATVNSTKGPFLPPKDISVSGLADLGSRRLTFSWSPVASNCPAIHYNILALNCGSCPATTDHTNVTCTDIPVGQQRSCTFSVQTVVCENITGLASKPINVLLSNNGNGLAVVSDLSGAHAGLIGALVAVIVLLAIILCVTLTAATISVVKITRRLHTQLESYKRTMTNDVILESGCTSEMNSTKNIAYESNPLEVGTKKNAAYETSVLAVEIKENVSYEL